MARRNNVQHSEILKNHLMLSQLVYEIRDPKTGSDRFRLCIEKIGEYLALEVMQELKSTEVNIQTLGGAIVSHRLCDEVPVLITILRAGIPLLLGIQRVFPHSEVGFLGMARNEKTLKAATSYVAIPEVKDKSVIIADTMLATGGSTLDAIKILEKDHPRKMIVLSAIASKEGVAKIQAHDSKIKVYCAAIDPSLDEKGYIVPGLGDAGERAYGKKN